MGPAKNNLAEFGGRKAPKPQKTRKFHFFFQNPAILGSASRKRVIFDRVTLCFATVSDFFSQKIAARCSSGTLFVVFFDFLETDGDLEGHQCAPPLPCTARGGHDIADFGVIWGRFFFDQKNFFVNFDFDKTGWVWTHWRSEKKFCGLFFSLGRCNGAGQK